MDVKSFHAANPGKLPESVMLGVLFSDYFVWYLFGLEVVEIALL